MTSGGGGGGAGGAFTGVVDSGVSNASSESELLLKSLARPWQAEEEASTPSLAGADGKDACSEAGAAAGEVLGAVRSGETWPMISPWREAAAKSRISRSSRAAGWMMASVAGGRPRGDRDGPHGAALLLGRNCQKAPSS